MAVRKKSGNNGSKEEQLLFNELYDRAMVLNDVLLGRSNWLEYLEGTVRDIDKECGYPATSTLTVDKYYKPFYERHAIATRVVEVMPEECWRMNPEVFETEDPEDTTPFEDSWNDLSLSLIGESKFKRKKGSPLWEYLQRVDILSGIGHYGVLFLGLDDGQEDLSQPAEAREGQKLLFLRALDESLADITQYENDPTNPRFGLPTMYSLTFSSPEEKQGLGVATVTEDVHWSRVIHVADNMGNSEVFGVPRMRPVFNRLWDLRKLYGGSGEMYWKGAFPGISYETHPQLGASFTISADDKKVLREEIEKFQEGLQRYKILKGLHANSLAPQVVDPSPQIDVQLEAICVQLGIPKRIFLGSERGELASSQDKESWNERLAFRQNGYLTPRVVVPLVDRLISLGVLVEPGEEDGYSVTWPDLDRQTDDEKATVAVKTVEALAKFVAGDVTSIMAPMDLYTKLLGMEDSEAEQILESAMEFEEEEEDKNLEKQVEEAKMLQKITGQEAEEQSQLPPAATADQKLLDDNGRV